MDSPVRRRWLSTTVCRAPSPRNIKEPGAHAYYECDTRTGAGYNNGAARENCSARWLCAQPLKRRRMSPGGVWMKGRELLRAQTTLAGGGAVGAPVADDWSNSDEAAAAEKHLGPRRRRNCAEIRDYSVCAASAKNLTRLSISPLRDALLPPREWELS